MERGRGGANEKENGVSADASFFLEAFRESVKEL